MNTIKSVSAALALAVSLGAATTALAGNYTPDYGESGFGTPTRNYAEGQNVYGAQHEPGCVRDFWGTSDCGPTSWREFGPYDGQHAMERGDQIQR